VRQLRESGADVLHVGQWLHMKTTSSAVWPLKSVSETVFPLVSGNRKSGAAVPSGSMVEGVSDMREMWNGARNFASGEVTSCRK